MLLFDVNIYVYAHREDSPHHKKIRTFVEEKINTNVPFGFSDLVASSFLRIVTHQRIFNPPSPLSIATQFISEIRNKSNAVLVYPKENHWETFTSLCREFNVKGNLIADAYLAALAIEWGCEWITTDRDYSRFSHLNWRTPD